MHLSCVVFINNQSQNNNGYKYDAHRAFHFIIPIEKIKAVLCTVLFSTLLASNPQTPSTDLGFQSIFTACSRSKYRRNKTKKSSARTKMGLANDFYFIGSFNFHYS